MKHIERRRVQFRLIVGALLTVTVALADAGGGLRFLEQKLNDLRWRTCQFFLKPPAPPVHLDIDGAALQGIGMWPWKRSVVAEIVDELYAAGAKVVAFDVLYSEPSEPDPGEDERLARALGGGSILAVELGTPGGAFATSPAWPRLTAALEADLELTPEAARARLVAFGAQVPDRPEAFEALFLAAREAAMLRRVAAVLDTGAADPQFLRAVLLPKSVQGVGSPVEALFNRQLALAQRDREMRRFMRPLPPGAAPPDAASNPTPPVLPLVRAAAGVGFVNYDPDPGGVLRAVPLLRQVDGRLLPQLGLAAACQMLGVDVAQVRVTADAVVIPAGGPGGDVVIPVHTRTLSHGRAVPYCVDVPLFGRPDAWETMYDFPRHRESAGHLTALAAYRIAQTRQTLARNREAVDRALIDALGVTDPEAADDYRKRPPDARPRDKTIEKTAADIPEKIAELGVLPDQTAQLLAEVKRLRQAQTALALYPVEAGRLRAQLDGQRDVLARNVKGRTVFVGWVAEGNSDKVPTPLHQICPGVVVHGAVYNAIMSRALWRQAPAAYAPAATAFLGLLATLAVARLSPVGGLAWAVGLTAAYAGVNGVFLFDYHHLIAGAAGPVAAAWVVWAGLTLARAITERQERARITSRFQSYVDPTLVDFVVEHPDVAGFEGQERELTVVFTDLQGFTTLSERLGVRTVKVLSKYMEAMVPVIRDHRGYVNKFLGDGIMCFFGAPVDDPDHAAAAVSAVLAMRSALVAFNETLAAQGLPTLVMRAGISTGLMVVGDAGPSFASDYTVLGDRVNLAARLESANKAFGTGTLMTARTVELAGDRFLFRPVAALQVVGKDEVVMTYEVLCPRAEADDRQRRLADLTATAVRAFTAHNFAGCCDQLAALDAEFGESKLTKLYRAQCDQCAAQPPPPGWAGQIALREK